MGYRLKVRFVGLFFAGVVFFAAPLPAFAQIQIVPDGGCYEQGDYSIGIFGSGAEHSQVRVEHLGRVCPSYVCVGRVLMLSSAGEDKRVTQGEVLIKRQRIDHCLGKLDDCELHRCRAHLGIDKRRPQNFPARTGPTSGTASASRRIGEPGSATASASSCGDHRRSDCGTSSSSGTRAGIRGSSNLCCIKIETQELVINCIGTATDYSVGAAVNAKIYGWEKLGIPAAECPTKSLPQYVASCVNTGRQNVYRMTRLPVKISCVNQDCPQINSGTGAVSGGCQAVVQQPPQPNTGSGAQSVPVP